MGQGARYGHIPNYAESVWHIHCAPQTQSIYGRTFPDEKFMEHEPFCLSMANAGPNTNGSQFFITTVLAASALPVQANQHNTCTQVDTPWLNGRHVVFGRVLEGKELVDKLQNLPVSRGGRPEQAVVIADCGKLVA